MSTSAKACTSLLLLAVLVGALPGVLYLLGLASIQAMPLPAAVPKSPQAVCDGEPLEPVARLDPWRFTAALFIAPLGLDVLVHRQASWVAARHLLRERRGGMVSWHLANAALTIWITRHWSATQIATTAHAEHYCRDRIAVPNSLRKPRD